MYAQNFCLLHISEVAEWINTATKSFCFHFSTSLERAFNLLSSLLSHFLKTQTYCIQDHIYIYIYIARCQFSNKWKWKYQASGWFLCFWTCWIQMLLLPSRNFSPSPPNLHIKMAAHILLFGQFFSSFNL